MNRERGGVERGDRKSNIFSPQLSAEIGQSVEVFVAKKLNCQKDKLPGTRLRIMTWDQYLTEESTDGFGLVGFVPFDRV